MKLRLFAGPLADAVSYTAKALPSRAPLPVLLGMMLTTGPHGLHLAAGDGDVYATATATAEVADDGRALLPGRLLADICARLPKGADVDLELDTVRARLVLVCGSARFTLPTLPLEEYPTPPAPPDAVATLDADRFAGAVAQTAVALDRDGTLPALTCIQLRMDGEQLALAATDRYRIGLRHLTVRPTGTQPPVPKRRRKADAGEAADGAHDTTPRALVPGKALAEAARALEGEHTLTLHWSPGLVGLSIPGRTWLGRQLDGYEFPALDGLFSQVRPLTVTVASADAIAAVQRVALVATRNTPVTLTITGGEMRIEGGSGDDAQAVDRIPANVDGDLPADGYTIAFNPAYLADALRSLDGPEAAIAFGPPLKPALLRGRAGETAEHYQHILMPVRLSG